MPCRHSTVALLLVAAVSSLACADRARAQEPAGSELVEQGVQAYEAGEFERAAELFDRATSSDGLSRADLVRLLSHRVLVAEALGDRVALDRALVQLVTLDSEGLGASASPKLQRLKEQAVERTGGAIVDVEVEHEKRDGDLLVRTRVRGDAGGLVQRESLRGRVDGGPWMEGEGGELSLPDAEPEDVEVVARAIGPAGAELAQLGTEDDPRRLARAEPPGASALGSERPREDERDGGLGAGAVLGIGAAAAVVVAAIVVGAVLGTGGGRADSDVKGPDVQW